MRVLSGIQPTGRPHWGNWFGAVQQYIALQDQDEAYYFVANLHALTTIRDGEVLYQNSLDTAIDMLALGLDPEKAVLFLQSDVPEVSELCWILMSGLPKGMLDRCVSYKARHCQLFQSPVRRCVRGSGTSDPRPERKGSGHRWRKDVQELRELYRGL